MTPAVEIGEHWEADVEVRSGAGGPQSVVKRYRLDSPCIAWLNDELARWYDPAAGLPVAQHEHAAFVLLSAHGLAPRPLELRESAIVTEWGGVPLSSAPTTLSRRRYRQRAVEILAALRALGFRHNDLIDRNVLVAGERVTLIDFTLAEWGPVTFMDRLPDPAWARAGQDAALPGFARAIPRRTALVAAARRLRFERTS